MNHFLRKRITNERLEDSSCKINQTVLRAVQMPKLTPQWQQGPITDRSIDAHPRPVNGTDSFLMFRLMLFALEETN